MKKKDLVNAALLLNTLETKAKRTMNKKDRSKVHELLGEWRRSALYGSPDDREKDKRKAMILSFMESKDEN